MIKNLIKYLHSLKASPTPLLGRWCNRDTSKNNWKIDMANTDHCGTCSYTVVKDTYTTTSVKDTDIKYGKNTKPL